MLDSRGFKLIKLKLGNSTYQRITNRDYCYSIFWTIIKLLRIKFELRINLVKLKLKKLGTRLVLMSQIEEF